MCFKFIFIQVTSTGTSHFEGFSLFVSCLFALLKKGPTFHLGPLLHTLQLCPLSHFLVIPEHRQFNGTARLTARTNPAKAKSRNVFIRLYVSWCMTLRHDSLGSSFYSQVIFRYFSATWVLHGPHFPPHWKGH